MLEPDPGVAARVRDAASLMLAYAAEPTSVGQTLSRFLPDLGIVNREAQLGTIEEVGELAVAEYTQQNGQLQPWVVPTLRDLASGPVFLETRVLAGFAIRLAMAKAIINMGQAGA